MQQQAKRQHVATQKHRVRTCDFRQHQLRFCAPRRLRMSGGGGGGDGVCCSPGAL
jgi:hypothetical protein